MTTPTSPAPTPAPKRKSGRWWKILLGIVIALFILILLTPTLLSTSFGKNYILSQINSRMPNKLNAESISLGWFSGASVRKLEMVDNSGKPIVSFDVIDTGVSLWDALAGSTIDLSKVSITGGKMPQLPGTTVSLHLIGSANLSTKMVNITQDSTVSAVDDSSHKGTVLTLRSGSKFSWADQADDIHATLDYNWQQVAEIIRPSLPEGTVLAGHRVQAFHVTGAMTKDPGLAALRGITIDPAAIGFDEVAAKGFTLGKADIGFEMKSGILTLTPTNIPANGGTLTALGRVDFNQTPPAYIIDAAPQPHQLAKNVALNQQIAAGPLNFLPLAWGDKTGNLADVGGLLNIQVVKAYIPLDSVAYKTKGAFEGNLDVANVSTQIPFLQTAVKDMGPLAQIASPDLFTIKGGNIPAVHFALAAGKVSYQNLTLGSSKVNLTFSGSVGLDTSLAMSVVATANQASIPIPIGLKGTTSKPEVSVDTAALSNPKDLGKTLQKEGPKILDQFLNKKK